MGGMDVKSRKPRSRTRSGTRGQAASGSGTARAPRPAPRRAGRSGARSGRDRHELPVPPGVPMPPMPRARDLRREIRRTIHEHVMESVEGNARGPTRHVAALEATAGQTNDDDAAAVRRRLKRNGRPEGTVTIMFTDIEGSTAVDRTARRQRGGRCWSKNTTSWCGRRSRRTAVTRSSSAATASCSRSPRRPRACAAPLPCSRR